jgi:hypothetical protein
MMDAHPNSKGRDKARSEAQLSDPDVIEPIGDWFVRITRPGCHELSDIIAANRSLNERPLPNFEE